MFFFTVVNIDWYVCCGAGMDIFCLIFYSDRSKNVKLARMLSTGAETMNREDWFA